MKLQRGGKIALFVGHDLIGLMIANKLVPEFIKLGCTPIIVNSGAHRNRKPIVTPPEIPAFYSAGIVDKILLPHLDSRPLQEAPEGSICRTYKQLKEIHGLDYIEVDDVNNPEFVERMKANTDLIGGLAIRSLQILNPETINVFEDKGFMWNLHGGLLPEYKGLLIPYFAIDNDEENYGWTLHKMDSGIDTGDVIDKAVRPLNRLSAVFNVYADMVPHAAVMVQAVLQNYLKTGIYRYTPQSPTAKQHYYTSPTSEQMDAFNRKGIQFVDGAETHIHYIIDQFCADGNSKEARDLQRALIDGTFEWRRGLSQEHAVPEKQPAQQPAGVRDKPSLLNAPQLSHAA